MDSKFPVRGFEKNRIALFTLIPSLSMVTALYSTHLALYVYMLFG